jgi:hypothetical protein
MNRKIIHVVFDEKFIDIALRQFEEVAPGLNMPIILSSRAKLRYVKNNNVRICSLGEAIEIVRSDLCAAVVFHSLQRKFLPLLKMIPNERKVFWLGWGFDYYDSLLSQAYPDGLLLPKTRALSASLPSSSLLLRARRKAVSIAKKILGKSTRLTLATLERVDYFCPVLEIEYEIVRQINPDFRPQYFSWNYGTIEDDLSNEFDEESETGEDVLVGNSATPQVNHIEVFDMLRDHPGIGERKIIVPLSYGDVHYREKIISLGRKYFGGQFVPITEFMPKSEYVNLLNSCGFVYMNHLRQQGMGNIIITIMKGAKVFMNPMSPAYQWLVRSGVAVHSIMELQAQNSQVWSPEQEEIRQKNIALLYQNFGRKVQMEKTRRLVEVSLGRYLK